jgi:hypothetical protein
MTCVLCDTWLMCCACCILHHHLCLVHAMLAAVLQVAPLQMLHCFRAMMPRHKLPSPSACRRAGMLVSPESPAWLVLKGQRREATSVAEKLWGADALVQLGSGDACCCCSVVHRCVIACLPE